jgi:hypothetical protein
LAQSGETEPAPGALLQMVMGGVLQLVDQGTS